MISVLLVLSAIVNVALSYELWRFLRKYRAIEWRERIVRESLRSRYAQEVNSPQAAKNFVALRQGKWHL